MKKGIFALATLTSFNCMAMDYLGAMYNPDKGTLYGTTELVIGGAKYDIKKDSDNSKTSYETSEQTLNQELEMGLGSSLVAMLNINYTVSESLEYNSTEKKYSGLQSVSFGARYRLSNTISLPFTVDVGAIIKPSFQDREEANTNDDGTANSGGHDIGFFARGGTNKLYMKFALDYHMEQTANDATSGDESYTIDPSIDLHAAMGSQLSPMEKLLIDGSAHFYRFGEQKINYNGGGDATYKAVVALGAEVQGYYEFMKGLSANAGFKYNYFQDQDLDALQNQLVESKTSTSFNIGASYRY